jgi:hypothetical protein
MLGRQEYHFNMRRYFTTALVAIALSCLALAQGPPASVTSPGFGGNSNKFNGVPAGVTSPGFGQTGANRRFFTPPSCCINPLFPGNSRPPVNHRHHFPDFPVAGAVYAVPYYVPVTTDEPVDDTMEQMQPQPQSNQYLGGPTVFDRRGPGMPAYATPTPRPAAQEPVLESDSAPAPEPAPAADQPQTLLVFKDGHKVEVQNYAIVGDMLYDMTPGHQRKVTLADLDIGATVKQNDDRGIDFRLPPPPKAK